MNNQKQVLNKFILSFLLIKLAFFLLLSKIKFLQFEQFVDANEQNSWNHLTNF